MFVFYLFDDNYGQNYYAILRIYQIKDINDRMEHFKHYMANNSKRDAISNNFIRPPWNSKDRENAGFMEWSFCKIFLHGVYWFLGIDIQKYEKDFVNISCLN